MDDPTTMPLEDLKRLLRDAETRCDWAEAAALRILFEDRKAKGEV